jgi:NAD(P)-dependent dehydrogenase (short-subunit alcohol dehydrogenase family)
MRWTSAHVPDLSDRTYIVTGANSGIGYEAALVLAEKGARVVLACRTESKARDALDGVRRARSDARAEFGALDLASLKSVRAFAGEMTRRFPEGVDGLVNNAGVMALPRQLTEDGFEMQLGTNHLGHFALTALLLPLLVRRPAARVVSVSSGTHWVGRIRFDDLMGERSYQSWVAYAQSKLANLLFTRELQRRLSARHPHVLATAAHPGYAATNLLKTSSNAWGGGAVSSSTYAAGNALFAQSAAAGGLPTVRALVDPDAKGGEFYGPSAWLWGAPMLASRSRAAQDDAAARKLWEASEQLTGERFEGI